MDAFFIKLENMSADDALCYLKQFSNEFIEQGFFEITEFKDRVPNAYKWLSNDISRRKSEQIERSESEQLSTLESQNVVDKESKDV